MRTEKIPVDTSICGDIDALFPPSARASAAQSLPVDEPPPPSGPEDYGLQDDRAAGDMEIPHRSLPPPAERPSSSWSPSTIFTLTPRDVGIWSRASSPAPA
jgi:hypothetical protein